ncbi:molybdate ABC transporter substrate-binding protein [Litoribrevibacter euphylliae]|uniref:Molybdate ABC transporter substrate-binding protein n=1 Tax=Litoribrevibacter euphylliae TaxID=1834034 RepID=A0ABV7HC59_9GAMM
MTLFRLLLTSVFALSTTLVQAQIAQAQPQNEPETLKIAVASNFTFAMKALIETFEQNTGHSVVASYGSSGKIFAQIQHGAPFQVFFSADQAKPIALETAHKKAGFSVPNSRFTYAIGALALWSSKSDLITDGASVLSSDKFNKLAFANPKLAPYGAAAVQVLEQLKLVKSTRSKWVQGENIAQTYQFVSTGNADLGFIALSQLKQAELKQAQLEQTQLRQDQQEQPSQISLGSSWIVPQSFYSPIKQDAILLKRGERSEAAKALISFVQSNEGKRIIESYGYTTPSHSMVDEPQLLDQQFQVDQ